MVSSEKDVTGYYSLYPFAHYAFFLPFGNAGPALLKRSGWYIGAGGGFLHVQYNFSGNDEKENIFAADFETGFLLFGFLDVSYTLRTNFKSASHKAAVGYLYRFGK